MRGKVYRSWSVFARKINIQNLFGRQQFGSISVGSYEYKYSHRNYSSDEIISCRPVSRNEPIERGFPVREIDSKEVSSWDEMREGNRNFNAEDDVFLKKLRKTTNKYWIDNAEQVFERMDWNRLLDKNNKATIEEDLKRRRSEADITRIHSLWEEWKNSKSKNKPQETRVLLEKLVTEALTVPNRSHNAAMSCSGEDPQVIYTHGQPRDPLGGFDFEYFNTFCEKRDLLRTVNLGNLTYPKSYILKGPLAELEQALIRHALNKLTEAGFHLISVPDIIEPHIIEACGFPTRSKRSQIFWLDGKKELCLSGTAEMGIGHCLQGKTFSESELPQKLMAISRCFRAETSAIEEEKGLYRVHQFTKVEMFGLTPNETGEESNSLQEKFRGIQESIFADLGLHFKTLEMPPIELGPGAHRKFDIEAWMPARKLFGEISSCSNCTDFQSRRLNIQYKSDSGNHRFVHTVNGTACAVPRMLIALIETFQQRDGSLAVPPALEKFMTRSWREAVAASPNIRFRIVNTNAQLDRYFPNFVY